MKSIIQNAIKHAKEERTSNIREPGKAVIIICGVGGGGNNTVKRMMHLGIQGAECIAINTDKQHLDSVPAHRKILVGEKTTRGLGAGGDPELGAAAAEESRLILSQALEGADMVFVTCGLGGGCLTGDSLVYTNPEGPIRIDSIKPGSLVYSMESGKIVRREVVAAMKTGTKRVFAVKTRNQTLQASYDHPFLKVMPATPDMHGRFSKFDLRWTPAESLRPGDLVVILRKAPEIDLAFAPNHGFNRTEEFCWLFGFLVGDGWITRSKDSWKVFFSLSLDEGFNEKIATLMKEILGLRMKRAKNWYYANSKEAYELLENLGLNRKAKVKEIPPWIFQLPDSCKKAFILGLADADGNYYRQNIRNGREKVELRFEMSSEKLIRQLKTLCNYLGLRTSNVASRTREIKPPSSKQKGLFTSWGLRIYKLHQLDGRLERTRVRSGLGFLYGYRGPTDSEFFENFGFARIRSNEQIGEREVFDVTVNRSHNFVAEGFLVHNTGTGGAPILAEIAKQVGAIVIGVVTLPFKVEGELRNQRAREGLSRLREHVDTVVVVDNNKLLEVAPDYPIEEAFAVADEVLATMVKGITETIKLPSLINLDFADIRSIMGVGGVAIIGIGEAEGESRAEKSVEEALNNPLLSLVVTGATGALVHVSGGADMTLSEATRVAELVTRRMAPSSKVIWGARVSPSLNGIIRTILLLTGIKGDSVLGPDADLVGFEAGFHELAEMKELGVEVESNVIETTGRIEALKRQDAKASEFGIARSAFSQQKRKTVDIDLGLQKL